MRFYIASSLNNYERVRSIAEDLKSMGHVHTYDWTVHGDLRNRGESAMSQAAFQENYAIRDAELFVCMLPGGFGTHVELGAAIATRSNKRIVLWAEDEEYFNNPQKMCMFYFHSSIERVCCGFEELRIMLHSVK